MLININKAMLLTFDPAYLEDILVPIFVCFALPIGIVFCVMWAKRNETNRKAEVAMKAIEKGVQIDPSFFGEVGQGKKSKSVKEKVFGNLKSGLILSGLGIALIAICFIRSLDYELQLCGAVLLCLGLAFVAFFFISKKHFAAEIKAEEDKLSQSE